MVHHVLHITGCDVPALAPRSEVVAFYILEQLASGRIISQMQAIQELIGSSLLDPGIEQERGIRPTILRGLLDPGLSVSLEALEVHRD